MDEDVSDEADEIEEAEQLYCYCNGPSHGEMVACDQPGCAREWFHLKCVGLTKPPPDNGETPVARYESNANRDSEMVLS